MSLSKKTIIGFINGQQEDIAKVYVEYKNLMYFVIASYIDNQDDCDDVLSEAFLKAVKNARDINSIEKLRPYLCSIAKNEALNYLKKIKAVPASDIIEQMYGEEDCTNELLNLIEPLLTNKETIVVYYRVGFSYSWKELEEETGIPESTARRIYSKAKEKLSKELFNV